MTLWLWRMAVEQPQLGFTEDPLARANLHVHHASLTVGVLLHFCCDDLCCALFRPAFHAKASGPFLVSSFLGFSFLPLEDLVSFHQILVD